MGFSPVDPNKQTNEGYLPRAAGPLHACLAYREALAVARAEDGSLMPIDFLLRVLRGERGAVSLEERR
jgi:hypothetical protein